MDNSKRSLKKYIVQKKLGTGQFAEVWKAVDIKTNKTYAIKIPDNKKMKETPKLFELLQSEILILQGITNENVVRFYESFFEVNRYYIVMEYCNGGTLEDYMRTKKKRCIDEKEAIGYFKQLLNGFKALHQIKAMHRDFKLANILINDGILKIADFGLSKQAEFTDTRVGTPFYMAPEILNGKRYNNKIDIWALGVCLYEMLYGTLPFVGFTEKLLVKNMENNHIDFSYNGREISHLMQDLIKKMLIPDPIKRIDWVDIYEHEALVMNEFKEETKNSLEGGSILQMINRKTLEDISQYNNMKKLKEYYKENDKEMKYVYEDNVQMIRKLLKIEIRLDDPEISEEKLKKQVFKANEKNKGKVENEKIVKNAQKIENYAEIKENVKKEEKQEKIENKHSFHEILKITQKISEKTEKPENLEKNEIFQENPEMNEKLDKEIAENLLYVSELENKYFHWRNVISFHAQVLNECYALIRNENGIYLCYILIKRILYESNRLLEALKSKTNEFLAKELYFEEFLASENYRKLYSIFQEEKNIYDVYYEFLLVQIKNYPTYQENPLYAKLKNEFERKYNDVNDLMKSILVDYVFNGFNYIEGYQNEYKVEEAKKFTINLIQLVDCFRWKEEFGFNNKDEGGFDFKTYEMKLKEQKLEDLIYRINEIINKIL